MRMIMMNILEFVIMMMIVRIVEDMMIRMMAIMKGNFQQMGKTKEKLDKGSLTMHFMLCVGLLVKGEWRQELRAAPL